MIQQTPNSSDLIEGEPAAQGAADWFYATVMGVVEGLTEFLPVSSTGHLIVTSRLFERLEDPAFEIGIQMGAITAILFIYWGKVFGALKQMFGGTVDGPKTTTNLLVLIVVAAIPASVTAVLFEDHIEELLFNPKTVAITLVIGGVAFLVLEAWQKRRPADAAQHEMESMTIKQALWIGVFQVLALIPGTSRSGSMIVGGMVMGFKRTACAEFSFLVGLPILYGAAVVKLMGETNVFATSARTTEFVVASVASFISAAMVVGPFVRFLQRHTFVPFGWYRIVAGTLLLVLIYSGFLAS